MENIQYLNHITHKLPHKRTLKVFLISIMLVYSVEIGMIVCYCLFLAVAPVITAPPMDLLEAVEQESVLFICEATGRPRPRITWYKADDSGQLTVIDVTDSRINISHVEDGEREIMSNLTLNSVLPSDSATYVCSAENEVAVDGVVRENASLIVNGMYNIHTYF